MEATTAFQLACGVIQLIDFGFVAVKTYRQISKNVSSLSTSNEQIDEQAELVNKTASDVDKHLREISLTSVAFTSEQQHLKRVAERCTALATELRDTLNRLKFTPRKHRKDKLLQTWKTFRNKRKINDLNQRLRTYQQQLDSANLVNLW